MAERGDLLITNQKVSFNRNGKSITDYAIGTYTGNGGRIVGDFEGGLLEWDPSRAHVITKAYRATLSALGSGVVDIYLDSPTAEAAKGRVEAIIAGKGKDILGRSLQELGWKKRPSDVPGEPSVITLKIVSMLDARK